MTIKNGDLICIKRYKDILKEFCDSTDEMGVVTTPTGGVYPPILDTYSNQIYRVQNYNENSTILSRLIVLTYGMQFEHVVTVDMVKLVHPYLD